MAAARLSPVLALQPRKPFDKDTVLIVLGTAADNVRAAHPTHGTNS
jgi:hypothetical protein